MDTSGANSPTSAHREKLLVKHLRKTMKVVDEEYAARRLEADYCGRIEKRDNKLVCTKPEKMAKELTRSWIVENLEDILDAETKEASKKASEFGSGHSQKGGYGSDNKRKRKSQQGGRIYENGRSSSPPPDSDIIENIPHVAEMVMALKDRAKAREEDIARLDKQLVFWEKYVAEMDKEIAIALANIYNKGGATTLNEHGEVAKLEMEQPLESTEKAKDSERKHEDQPVQEQLESESKPLEQTEQLKQQKFEVPELNLQEQSKNGPKKDEEAMTTGSPNSSSAPTTVTTHKKSAEKPESPNKKKGNKRCTTT